MTKLGRFQLTAIRALISPREWFGVSACGFALGAAALALGDSLDSDRAAFALLWAGYLLEEAAGLGGHDGGIFLLWVGTFAFYTGSALFILIAVKLWHRRNKVKGH